VTDEPTGAERRRAPRVEMPPEGGAVSIVGGRILDVSIHGMRIESVLELDSESVHRFRLIVAREKMDVEAKVACCVRLDPVKRRFGVGMEFVDLEDEHSERLSAALAPLLKE